MKVGNYPARGAPAVPQSWNTSIHRGPAAREGAIPKYLLNRKHPVRGRKHLELWVMPDQEGDRQEQCDVVVIGSGAGGAVVAEGLARRGLRVLVLEEGSHFASDSFAGPPIDRVARMYRDGGATMTIGKVAVPLPYGKSVGGTTTVNAGTCFRAPASVLNSWQHLHGVEGSDPESMDPWYREVERGVSVRPVPWELLGPNGWIAHTGAAALGLTGGPILRNITHCHGSGQCVFGCPTDAKQAMAVSYLPQAVAHGARIYANTVARWLLMEKGRAVGLVAERRGSDGTHSARLIVRSKAVVLAGGAIGSPTFLLANHVGNSSRTVGRNLTIHPATGVMGYFDDAIDGWRGTLQPYYIDALFDTHRVMIEATNSVPSVGAAGFPGIGAELKRSIASYPHMATLGLLVQDDPRGRVLLGPGRRPVITYSLGDGEVTRIYEGLSLAARVLLAAGARWVTAGIHGLDDIRDEQGLERLRRGKGGRPLKLSAFHPMGTCRMGSDPAASVVGPDLQSHDVAGLYIADASVFPSCLGVNPQMTIMAFAARCAATVAARLA